MSKESIINRRQFLACSSVVIGAFLDPTNLQAKDRTASDSYRDFESSEIPDLRPLGTDPAKSDEIALADKLLLASPEGKQPIDVISYLELLQDHNVDGEFYNGGWRKRWNPIIVRFFGETKTKPAGDTTAWCAACLNWVLARSGYDGTRSASSGSFRNVPGLTTTPQRGDIVVFESTDPQEAKVGHGHVALFLKQTADSILVTGGNQKNEYGHHAVCQKWIRKRGATLTFHSFHSIAAFKST